MKEDIKEVGAILETISLAEGMNELSELQLLLIGGGFGEVVLV
jgi:hypothetical protein